MMDGGVLDFPPPLLEDERLLWEKRVRNYLLIAKILVPKNTFLKHAEQTIGDMAARRTVAAGTTALELEIAERAIARALAAVVDHRSINGNLGRLRVWDQYIKSEKEESETTINTRYAVLYERISLLFNIYENIPPALSAAGGGSAELLQIIENIEAPLLITLPAVPTTLKSRIETVAGKLFTRPTIAENRAAWEAYMPEKKRDAFRGFLAYLKQAYEIKERPVSTTNDSFLERMHDTIRENTESVAGRYMTEIHNIRMRLRSTDNFSLERMTTRWLIDRCGADIARAKFADDQHLVSGRSGRAIDRAILAYNHSVIRPMYDTIRARYRNEFGFI